MEEIEDRIQRLELDLEDARAKKRLLEIGFVINESNPLKYS